MVIIIGGERRRWGGGDQFTCKLQMTYETFCDVIHIPREIVYLTEV